MNSCALTRRLDSSFASWFRAPKNRLVDDNSIEQTGGALLDIGPFEWPDLAGQDEAVIVSYAIDPSGEIEALSDDEHYVEAWRPLVAQLVTSLVEAAATHGFELAGTLYATASITPVAMLEGQAHLDDDHFAPDDGVGLVTVLGQHVGPRLATEAVPHDGLVGLAGPYPLTIEAELEPSLRPCQAGPDQAVVFAQFGQLHAGPSSADFDSTIEHRQLVVLRAATRPA